MLRRRDADGDDAGTTAIESDRRSIDEGWASLTKGTEPGTDHGAGGRAHGPELTADDLQAAYDAATRRAADWYSSRLGPKGEETRRGRHRPRHVSRSAVPTPRDDRTGRTAGVDR